VARFLVKSHDRATTVMGCMNFHLEQPHHRSHNQHDNTIMASCSHGATKTSDADDGTTSPKKCVPCSTLDPSALLSRDQVEKALQESPELSLWKCVTKSMNNGKDVLLLSFSFVAKNFQAAMDALNAFGAIAEREQHHPDFHLTSYRTVEIHLWTHKVGGITQNDIDMAQMFTTEVKIECSPKWLKEHPQAAITSKKE
jgi:4a-hydroxytetrahydrobiopterin dehydratase